VETPIQIASREAARTQAYEQGKLGPFEGLVVSIQSDADEMGVSFGPTRERKMPIQHPFTGLTSWIRSVPETGSRFLMQNRFDTGQAEAIKTMPMSPGKRSQDYTKGLNLYRTLEPGEHDLASSGGALAYFSKRGHLDLRSGATIKSQLSRDNQSKSDSAPTFKRELLFHDVGQMGDEERLGVIKRWSSAIDEFFPQKNKKFLAEHYLQLKNPAGSAPAVLFKSQEGHVYDDLGVEVLHSSTSVPLRSQKTWYTTTDEFAQQAIDQNGNWLVSLPSTAETGYELQIPDGDLSFQVGVDQETTVGGDSTLTVEGNYRATASEAFLEGSGAKLRLTGSKVALGNDTVELVDILIQTLQALSIETAVGFGAPITGVATYAQLAARLAPLKGSF
jgi:hypothetical protein